MLEVIASLAMVVLAVMAGAAAWAWRRTARRLVTEVDRREGAEREAEHAHRVRREILARVSHELRTPVHGVLGMADLLLFAELSAARQYQALEAIRISAEVQLALIDDLLCLSRAEIGKLEFHDEVFELRGLLEKTLDLLRLQADDKGLELHLHVDDKISDGLYGDPARLRQILLNLVGNAVKYTHQGEVTLHVEQFQEDRGGNALTRMSGQSLGEPDAAGPPEEASLLFTVRDTGIGISPKDQVRIFAPFVRADTTAARESEGTGLGLVISKSLVEAMGGEIGFESTRGSGSAFWFRLALLPAREPVASTRSTIGLQAPLPVAADAPHVLVVDDNAVSRLVAENQLRVLGLRCSAVANGVQALAKLVDEDFDIVLMDCQMPMLDGYETTRRLRRREDQGAGRAVVIGTTAYTTKESLGRALAAGMDDCLAKPFRVGMLLATLERWLPLAMPRQTAIPEATNPGSGPLAFIQSLDREAGASDLIVKTAASFRQEGVRGLESIRGALAIGDGASAADCAHAFGGCCAVLGASVLTQLCRELESLARLGDLSACNACLPALSSQFEELAGELEQAAEESAS